MTIISASVVTDHIVRFVLDDGREVERDFSLLRGPVFDLIWSDPKKFRKVKIVDGVPTWPGEVELCPDAVLRGGLRGKIPASATFGTGGRLISAKPVRELVLRARPTLS